MSILDLEGATFETFVEGPSNRAAAVAARAAADHPANGAMPLVLIGPAGVGKSHLLSAITASVRSGDPGLEVIQESPATLLERAQGLGGGLTPLHECGLLVLDEVEQMADHPELEGVLLELLLGRLPFGRPIVLASGMPLDELGRVGGEIVEQLGGGQGVILEPPDAGTRLAILRRRAAELTPGLADEVLAAVARLPIASVRELLAGIQRLVAFQSVSPAPLDPAQARLLITGRSTAPDGPESTPAVVPPPREAPQRAPPAVPDTLAIADDEFGSFLTEVVASVSHQVDRWRTQVGEAILRHGGEGFRTRRLEALLEQEMPARPGEVVERFEQEVQRLRELEATAASLDPQLAGADIFRDPDQIEAAEAALARARLRHDPLPGPSPDLRLDHFGEGPGNRHALQAARGIVASPGTRDNPLVIVGASGTGKTHLLHAIGNQLAAAGGPVACVASAAFAGEIARLLESGGLASWRSRYQQASVLLLDDLHLLAGHAEAQEEFLALFTHLLAHGRQVVVSTNTPPATLTGVNPRLLSRLEAGLVVELPRPDREIRLQVVKQLLAGSDAAGDTALADWLANRPAESIRAVQGAVHRVLRAAESEGVPPSPALAREVLERSGTVARPPAPGLPTGLPPIAFRAGLGPEKMVTVWPRLGDRLIEELD